MIYIRFHNTDDGLILAMCDSLLIDKVLEEGEVYIDIKDYSEFYKGDLVEPGQAKALIVKDEIRAANIIGDEAVDVAIDSNIIRQENVKKVNGVRYAHAYKVDKPGQEEYTEQ
ncbi:MAG: DUF424 family protein [Candidatus Micrarchaeia archaeon]